MKDLRSSGQYRKDLRLARRRGCDLNSLTLVLDLLRDAQPLPEEYSDHPLKGEWQGCRDCHIGSDWLLIYRIEEDEIVLMRTGTHSDLFG